ncbi:adenylate/guanylate cyclase domain-containing protein [Pyxidicoccus trucidator]|uniref:adenylate/guanylate cyclase domain-containing protein n=1 Tax=Pyxidicoccus trucidator TaxID=2709662 RepID=UPI0013DC6D37|nr:adenylate/guanylate cyclase domain-containing protein [Pyxidicoccus trucidator]
MTTPSSARFPLKVRLALHGGTLLVGAFTYLYARLVCTYICALPPHVLLHTVLALSAVHILLREGVFHLAPEPDGRRTQARQAYLLSVATWVVTGFVAFGLHLLWYPTFPFFSHVKLGVGYWLLGGGLVAQVEYLLFEQLQSSTASPAAQLRERLGHRLMEGYVLFTTIPVVVLLLTLARMVGDLHMLGAPQLEVVLDQSMREAMLLAAAITVAALVAALAYGRSLRRDSERLLEAVRRVGGGDLHPHAATSRPDELGLVALGINDMADGLRLRERIREAFGRFVSPQVANEFIEKFARPGRATELGGQRRDVVLLFSDLRDFTPLSESLAPEDLIGVLNGYFGEMVAAIQKHGGMVDKFIGDAVLAVFGLTGGTGNPAESAVAAAREMQQRLEGYNARLAERGLCLRAGIGIHAGEVVAGYLGSAERLEFTVIGHAVNVAARIESHAREPRPSLLFSAEVARRLTGTLEVQEVESVSLKGVAEPMSLFTVPRASGDIQAA